LLERSCKFQGIIKGEYTGTNLGNEELMLLVAKNLAQRSRNPKVLNATITRMPRADKFCICKPDLESEEMFGS
jgi:hypothetical protein